MLYTISYRLFRNFLIADNPQLHDIYKKPGNDNHDLDHPGYSGEHEYGVDSTNEVGKERLSAKGEF